MARLLVVVAFALAGCGSVSAPSSLPSSATPVGSATPFASAAPTSTPAASPSGTAGCPSQAPIPTSSQGASSAEAAPLQTGALAPGRYAATAFDPQLTFTVGDGWTALIADDPDELALEGQGATILNVTRPSKVVDPKSGAGVAAPDDLIAWLAAHPSLAAALPKPVVVSGVRGRSIEVAPTRDASIFSYPTGDMHFPAGVRIRFFVVPLAGPDLVIVAGGPEASFCRASVEAQQIADSLQIGGS
jgi:hypothetical protein